MLAFKESLNRAGFVSSEKKLQESARQALSEAPRDMIAAGRSFLSALDTPEPLRFAFEEDEKFRSAVYGLIRRYGPMDRDDGGERPSEPCQHGQLEHAASAVTQTPARAGSHVHSAEESANLRVLPSIPPSPAKSGMRQVDANLIVPETAVHDSKETPDSSVDDRLGGLVANSDHRHDTVVDRPMSERSGGGQVPSAAASSQEGRAPADSRSIHVSDKLDITETRASAGGKGHDLAAGNGQKHTAIAAKYTPRPSTVTPAALRSRADRFADREFGALLVNREPWWKALPGDLASSAERRIRDGRFLSFVSQAARDPRKPVGEQLSDADFASAVEYAERANVIE